eukprot:gene33544-43350_t
MAQKQKQRQDDEDRNNKILATMRKMIHHDHMKYQRDLDHQLSDLRQRSMQSLQKTMTDQEEKYNSDLIKKSAKYM